MARLIDQGKKLPNGVTEISAQQVQAAQGVFLLDVREPDEFVGELGHIPGAVLIPLATLSIETLKRALPNLHRDAEIVCICRSGGRSAKAAEFLVSQGYTHVMNMTGGMIDFRANAVI